MTSPTLQVEIDLVEIIYCFHDMQAESSKLYLLSGYFQSLYK